MRQYSIEPRAKKYVKGYVKGFLSLTRKYKKQLLDTGVDTSKEIVHKAGEFFRNKIADSVTKSNEDNTEKEELVE